jgi:SAM-dependent methyltransferase
MGHSRDHLYADPHVYDVLHDEGTLADAKLFVRLARKHVPSLRNTARNPSLTLLEPACGSGRYLHALAKLDHTAIGIDLSAPMLAYARSRARTLGIARFVKTIHAPMQRFASRIRCDAAFNPINSIRHLGSDQAMLAHLACVQRALRHDGVYIVGLSLAAYGLESPTEDVWIAQRDGIKVTQVVQFEPPDPTARPPANRRERVISHLTIEDQPPTKREPTHRDSRYWLRTFNRKQWLDILSRAGWRVLHTCSNTGEPCEAREPGYYLFVLAPQSNQSPRPPRAPASNRPSASKRGAP